MKGPWIAGCLLAAWAAAAAAESPSAPHESLFRDLGAETQAVRTEAARRLEAAADLSAEEVRAALRTADGAAKPLLLGVVGARGMTGLVPDVVAAASSPDPAVSDAAVRALVRLGDDAVSAGLAALPARNDEVVAAARLHLRALAAKRAVERAVLGKWRRKGGTYKGRYASLAKLGWPVQPILLAMLLDVPVGDREVALPETDDPAALKAAMAAAIDRIARSDRRGYVTFDPLPSEIEPDEVFDLAYQAMKDVADVDLVGDVLEATSQRLQMVDEAAPGRLRRPEREYSWNIDEILFQIGRPERLVRLGQTLRNVVQRVANWTDGTRVEQKVELSYVYSEYARVLHQLERYDEAADVFERVIEIGRDLGGKEPAIAGYNRACALAQGGHVKEAIDQLSRSLDRDRSTGSEDLTREWVTEDGDLRPLHDDPRFKELVKKRYDE